jgi:hypothetical protein
MNVVFVSPQFPPNFYPFCQRLKELGATVLGVADESYDRLRPELRAALTEYYRVDSLEDYDRLVRALGHFTARHGKLHRIDSLNEHWLSTEARLREDFNIPGLRPAQVERAQRKSLMKDVFRQAGVACARGTRCRDAAAVRQAARSLGYPVVVKPDIGVGAAHTHKLTNDGELETFVATMSPGDYLVEEFVAGAIVTFDGLADRDGQVVFEASLRYSRGIMDVVNQGTDLWYYLERQIPDDLRAIGRRLVDGFEVRERFFHFEFFRLADGRLMALEVNLRPPGGLTVDMWNYQNDTDIFRAWAALVTTGRCDVINSREWYCAYAGRKRQLAYAVDHADVRKIVGNLVVHDQPVDDIFSAAIGNHGYILRSPELSAVEAGADLILKRG